ncbi:hypothetical protein HWV62_13233 [Athelia sp. TMB]|nr:hypothetical protein HWV62_13233 [Athelia sp. TMB]
MGSGKQVDSSQPLYDPATSRIPYEVPRHAQLEAKERRVWINPEQSKRKRQDSDAAQNNLNPDAQPKSKKRNNRGASLSDEYSEQEDFTSATATKSKSKGKKAMLAPAAREYPAPDFDLSSDADEGHTGYGTLKYSGKSRRKVASNNKVDDDSAGEDHSVASASANEELEESDGDDGLKGSSQFIRDTLALEEPQWSAQVTFQPDDSAPSKLRRKSSHSRGTSTSSRSSMSIPSSYITLQTSAARIHQPLGGAPFFTQTQVITRTTEVITVKQELEQPQFLKSSTPSASRSRYSTAPSRDPAKSHYRTPSNHRSVSRHNTPPSDADLDGYGFNDDVFSDNTHNSHWPAITRLVYSSRNKIDLKPQSKPIKDLLHVAVEDFRGDIFFTCTFPNLTEKVKMLRTVLRQVAKKEDLPQEIIERLKKDPDYNEALGGVPWARVSDWRAPLKLKAFNSIHTNYGPDLSDELLAALLHDQSYIYPGDPMKGTLKGERPYEHPAFIEVLREFYFTVLERRSGSKSIAARYASRFKRQDNDDAIEMPDAMIASVGAAIHSSLKDCQNGLSVPSAFAVDTVSDIYETHILILNGLKPAHCHALKAKLYRLRHSLLFQREHEQTLLSLA